VHHGWVDLNPERILVVDLDPSESNVWRYGLADCAGEMVVAGRLRFDPVTEQLEAVGDRDDLFPTAALLVRQKRYLPPIRYDLTIRPLHEVLRGPPGEGKTASSIAGPHRRATEGKAKGGGRTLGERAAGDPGPRGAPGGPGGR
jgi:hypothetical protein